MAEHEGVNREIHTDNFSQMPLECYINMYNPKGTPVDLDPAQGKKKCRGKEPREVQYAQERRVVLSIDGVAFRRREETQSQSGRDSSGGKMRRRTIGPLVSSNLVKSRRDMPE